MPADAPAIQAEKASLELFSVPVLSRIAIVQRDPNGLSAEAQGRVLTRSLAILASDVPIDRRPIAGALPIANTLGLFPTSKESSTTAVTYLFFRPDQSLTEQVRLARGLASRQIDGPDDALVGVTGAVPARVAQTHAVEDSLLLVTLVTIMAIGLTVGVYYRAVGPPLLTLAAAGLAFLVSSRILAWIGDRAGVSLPRDLEPMIVVLLLGIVTDYSIFFVTGFRSRLAAGATRIEAARESTLQVAPIVFTAGLIVAAGTAALLAASLGFLRAFGPALALTVLVSLLVSVTLIPAAMATLGSLLFWPRRPTPAEAASEAPQANPRLEGRPPSWRGRGARLMTAKPAALVLTVLVVGVLVVAATGLSRIRLGFTLISGLPSGSEELRAAVAASQGFADGVLSPTEVIVQGPGVGSRSDALVAVQRGIEGVPGVAGVIGPGFELPGGDASPQPADLTPGLLVSEDGEAARYIVILSDDPLGGRAVETLDRVQDRMPGILRSAGLPGVLVFYAGDTALSSEAIGQTLRDLVREALVALGTDLVLLIVFLRGLIAPLYLLAASVLGLAAAMGLATYLFQVVLGHGELTYYVPFAAAVLLVSLGSDYNIFVVGRIWEEARTRPLRDAISLASPRASGTISIAAVILALGFGLLALVPLVQFREFAFVMSAGILIDAFLVRSVLVPALIALFGSSSWWPWAAPRRRITQV